MLQNLSINWNRAIRGSSLSPVHGLRDISTSLYTKPGGVCFENSSGLLVLLHRNSNLPYGHRGNLADSGDLKVTALQAVGVRRAYIGFLDKLRLILFGDEVRLTLEPSHLLRASLLVYGLPPGR